MKQCMWIIIKKDSYDQSNKYPSTLTCPFSKSIKKIITFKTFNQIIGINGQPNPKLGFSKKNDRYQKLVWTLIKIFTSKNKAF